MNPEDSIFLWVVLLTLAAVIMHGLITILRDKRRWEKWIDTTYGTVPENEWKNYVTDFHTYAREKQPNPHAVDAITWNDLNMDEIYLRINRCVSSVGDEYLYHLLHELELNPETLHKREALVEWMATDSGDRKNMQRILMGIGKRERVGLSYYLFHAASKRIGKAQWYRIQAVLPLVALLVALWKPFVGAVAFIWAAGANILTYVQQRNQMEAEFSVMRYFSALLYAARGMERTFGDALREKGLDLRPAMAPFRLWAGFIPGGAQALAGELSQLTEIPKAIFLWDLLRFDRTVELLDRHPKEVREIFRIVGEVDCAISIASFRESLPVWCLPRWHGENAVRFNGMIHPLLTNPVDNSGCIDNDAIVTGSNASGKSTFIKSIAVNHILAQTIHTCTANQYALCPAYVCSSMALKDDILTGESYFVAEIKSLKRIIAYAKERRCICLIDEILRGTNTPERIAASTAVLRALHETDSLCLIASHDLELTEILRDDYDNYHFRETIEAGEIVFDYKLQQGPSTTTNAIRLLEYMGFDAAIVEEATRLVNKT